MLMPYSRAVSGVVHHHIEDESHASTVQLGYESGEIGLRPELRLQRPSRGISKIWPVAVIATGTMFTASRSCNALNLLIHWRYPNRTHPQLTKIVEFLTHAGQVSAMKLGRVMAIIAFWHAELVIGGIAIKETVRHDEIDHLLPPAMPPAMRIHRGADS